MHGHKNTATLANPDLKQWYAHPNIWFRKFITLCNGANVDDYEHYNGVSDMFGLFQSSNKHITDGVERCGHDDTTTTIHFNSMADRPNTIDQSKHAMVGVSLCSSLISRDTNIPLQHAPLAIELELVGNATDCLCTGNNGTLSPVVNATA